ncbi:MAG: histidine--tRNA ligase [bacterium]
MSTRQEKIKSVRGTRDFYPQDMQIRNYIFEKWKKVAIEFGFEEYDGPILEHLDLFTRKSGEEISAQLYCFKDKSDRDLAMRPEMTPTLARMVNQKGSALKRPIKWFSIPRLFRYERSMRGRLREFFQVNMDIMGVDDIQADAELIAALITILKRFGLSEEDFCVHISSRALYNSIFDSLGYNGEKRALLYAVLDKKDKMEFNAYRVFFLSKGFTEEDFIQINEVFGCDNLDDVKIQGENVKPLDDLKKLFNLLDAYGVSGCVKFTPSIVRGLAYYSGIVFEALDRDRSLRAIAGGGRFDNLLGDLGGEKLSAVGFGMGDVVLMELLKDKKLLEIKSTALDVYLVGVEPYDYNDIVKIASRFRKNGLTTAFNLKKQNLKKQMIQANQSNSSKVLFIGGEEAKRNLVRLKNMNTGKEDLLSFEEAEKDLFVKR